MMSSNSICWGHSGNYNPNPSHNYAKTGVWGEIILLCTTEDGDESQVQLYELDRTARGYPSKLAYVKGSLGRYTSKAGRFFSM